LAFTGADPYSVGLAAGKRLAKLVAGGEIALLVNSGAGSEVQARLRGAAEALRRASRTVKTTTVRTGASEYEAIARVDDWVVSRKGLRGLLAVDASSTQGAGAAMKKYGLAAKDV